MGGRTPVIPFADSGKGERKEHTVDVLSIIKNEHRAVSKLFDAVEACDAGDERVVELAKQIAHELITHLDIEERLFYARIKARAEESEELVDIFEAYTEHLAAKQLMELVSSQRKHDERFKAELQVLGENVRHHVKEEESKVFALARDLIDDEERNRIGEAWERAKQRDGARPGGRSNGRAKRPAAARSR